VSSSLERLQQAFKQLPGLGYRSAERIAVHLLAEKPERLPALVEALQEAASRIGRCPQCGHLSERNQNTQPSLCDICSDSTRDSTQLCILEQIPDLLAMERASAYRGQYHVLHGKLSPVHGVGESDLNLKTLQRRLAEGDFTEVILALSNEIEGEATCHYLREEILSPYPSLKISRIGFGLPSGSGLLYADATTLKSALEGRRHL